MSGFLCLWVDIIFGSMGGKSEPGLAAPDRVTFIIPKGARKGALYAVVFHFLASGASLIFISEGFFLLQLCLIFPTLIVGAIFGTAVFSAFSKLKFKTSMQGLVAGGLIPFLVISVFFWGIAHAYGTKLGPFISALGLFGVPALTMVAAGSALGREASANGISKGSKSGSDVPSLMVVLGLLCVVINSAGLYSALFPWSITRSYSVEWEVNRYKDCRYHVELFWQEFYGQRTSITVCSESLGKHLKSSNLGSTFITIEKVNRPRSWDYLIHQVGEWRPDKDLSFDFHWCEYASSCTSTFGPIDFPVGTITTSQEQP
jgi:hypothetical protein